MTRIPVHIVTGAPGAGKSALITRLCGERKDWLGLVNSARLAGESNLRPLAPSCPCCTGKVVLQVTLARALRATGACRVFVELGDAGHLAGLQRALTESPLGLSLAVSRVIGLPQDAGLEVAEIDS